MSWYSCICKIHAYNMCTWSSLTSELHCKKSCIHWCSLTKNCRRVSQCYSYANLIKENNQGLIYTLTAYQPLTVHQGRGKKKIEIHLNFTFHLPHLKRGHWGILETTKPKKSSKTAKLQNHKKTRPKPKTAYKTIKNQYNGELWDIQSKLHWHQFYQSICECLRIF